tara:strand:+ start:129 stop:659 length:531 start_codon:yes stop_codon:yes gene_type:complete
MHYNLETKYYFINKFDSKNINKLDKRTALIYRNYLNKKIDIHTILKIKNYCKNKNIKIFLANNVKLAIDLGLDGAYIPSFNKNFSHLNYSLKKNFKLIGSAHSLKEIRLKEIQKVEEIFLSSIFKQNNNFLGKYKFKLLKRLTSKPTVALGGVSRKNQKELKLIDCLKFAGISYFE